MKAYEMCEKDILSLFKECSVEGKYPLSSEETEYFWLQTKIVGWDAKECLDINNVYHIYLKALQNHHRIMELIEKTSNRLLLHNIQANISEKDLDAILKHIHRE